MQDTEGLDQILKVFEQVALDFRGQFVFVIIDAVAQDGYA